MYPGASHITGIYHIHSDFSYDGKNCLAEIATWAKNNRLDFVLLTEHDVGFDQEKFDDYCRQCSKHSGDVLLVPGIEYEVVHQGAIIHIGAIGLSLLLDRNIIEQGLLPLVEAIHRHGGLAILHHPNNIKGVLNKKLIEPFDFIELWNTKFDCGFAPNLQFLHWLQGMNSKGPYLVSADIHEVDRFGKANIAFIDMDIKSDTLQLSIIAHGMRQRRYLCRTGSWRFSPDGKCQTPNRLYRLLPVVCLIKKKVFRFARFFIPEKYRKAVFNRVNRSWIR